MNVTSSEKQLRVVVINSARKWIGEAARCMMLVEGLLKRNIPTLLICREGYALQKEASQRGIEHETLTMKGNFTGIDDLRDVLKYRRIVKSFKPSVIHCHRGKDHWLSAAVCMVLNKSEQPVLIRSRHVMVPVKTHLFNRWLYKHATSGVIAVSKGAASTLEGLPLKKSPHIIYSAVDSDRFNPAKRDSGMRKECGAGEGNILIGLVGRIQRIKGQHIFLEAARMISDENEDVRFVIAGKGSKTRHGNIRAISEKYGITDKVRIFGYLEDVESLIASLDLGVVASLGSEGSSRIVLEYMASGVPVVATEVGGIPEILEQGTLGYLVPPDNPEKLAMKIQQALRNHEKTEEKKKKAFEKARIYYSIKRCIEETIDCYRKYISQVEP